MKNYISINGCKIPLAEDQVAQIAAAVTPAIVPEDVEAASGIKLAEALVGTIVRIGDHEMVVLEHLGDGTTALIRKDLLHECMEFGENNNYDSSNVDKACCAFADQIAAIVGKDNVVEHTIDLTSDDGLKDYGTIRRKASLITADLYRRYVEILDKFPVGLWWWLATAFSTKRHDDDRWVKCVSPSGNCGRGFCNYGIAVRPFCILKSDIFVSI